MPDIFVSYNREDLATARRFADAFIAKGFEVWWDTTLRTGEAYDQVTEKALRSAKAVVVLWSRKSVQSRWVRAEATLADRNGTLLPVMIEPCERPIMFELTQTADLTHWRGEPDDTAWTALLFDVQLFVDRRPVPVVAAASAAIPSEAPTSGQIPGKRGELPSLAVLPFANRSGLAEDEVFAIGMVEDVIDALSQGANVRVIASSVTARFRAGPAPDLEAMGRQLGVRYLLEGNVRRAGPNLRVTAQLVEAASGEIVWTQKFDRPLTELAALQEELVLEVASHLDVQVFRLEMERALRKPADLTAWEAVMRAFAVYRHAAWSKESLAMGAQEARRAVTIAPEFGAGHAILALNESDIYLFFTTPDDAGEVARVRSHAERALALDLGNPAVVTYAALALTNIGLLQEGLHHAERALRLSPGNSLAHYAVGMASIRLDHFDDGCRHFDTAMRTAPGAFWQPIAHSWVANAHCRAGRWDEAMAAFDRSLSLSPDVWRSLATKALLYRRMGLDSDAVDWFHRARRAEPAVTRALMDMRLRRFFVNNPVRDEFIAAAEALWDATEERTERSSG